MTDFNSATVCWCYAAVNPKCRSFLHTAFASADWTDRDWKACLFDLAQNEMTSCSECLSGLRLSLRLTLFRQRLEFNHSLNDIHGSLTLLVNIMTSKTAYYL